MIISKYSGDSHSPRKESRRSSADLKWSGCFVGAALGTMMSAGLYMESGDVWARPEAMPMDVCTHRRKGELWMTTLKRLRLAARDAPFRETSSSSLACSRKLPIWLPTCRP